MRLQVLATSCLAAAILLLACASARATMPPPVGPVGPELSAAFARGLFDVEGHTPGLTASSTTREWFIPVIRVAFSDSAIVFPRVVLEQRLFDTTGVVPTGSMAEYYRWVSGGRLEVRGELVATVTLPHDRNFYAADAWGVNSLGSPNNSYGMFRDALNACDATVDFSRFDLDSDGYVDMLWIVHAGPGGETSTSRRNLWSITSRATAGWNNGSPFDTNDLTPGSFTQRVRIDRFTVLPELSGFHPGQPAEIGVFCHEFGHTLGLPDLYDTSALGGASNVGPGNWSLMSTGAYGGDGQSPESPSHLGAWSMAWLGWANRLRPTQDTTIVLKPLADGGPVLELSFQGEDSPEHFLMENRVRGKFDRDIPAEGLVIDQVDEAVVGTRIQSNRINTGPTPGLRILEADGDFDLVSGTNRGDANDPYPGQLRRTRLDDFTTPTTRTFSGAPTNLAIEDIVRGARDVTLRLRVRAAGWQAQRPVAPNAGEPQVAFGPATRSIITPSGRSWQVSCEAFGGRTAVVLRERPWPADWLAGERIDVGNGIVGEPTIAWLGGADLAVVWIDAASGRGQLTYRARVRGQWLPQRVLTAAAGGCFAPAIAADARGRVFASWIENLDPGTRLKFMSFLYATPYGQAVEVTGSLDAPTPPVVTAAGDGHAYVVWPELGSGIHVINAARFHPDSGLSARFRLTPNSAYAQPTVSAVVDSSGVLHTVWQVSSGTSSEIHYQRRQPSGRPSQRDTTLDALGSGLQNPRLALDPAGGFHVAYERSVDGVQRLRYKHFQPGVGWDHRGTDIDNAGDLSTSWVELLPTSWGNVTVLWAGYDGVRQVLRQQERRLDGTAVTAVEPPPPPRARALAAGPNPLHAGRALLLSAGPLERGDRVTLFDASGREVARTIADAGRARFEPAATGLLAPGLYFVRVPNRDLATRLVVLR